MTMTAPIALPYATPRVGVEVDIDTLVPIHVVRIPAWLTYLIALYGCARDGHRYGRVTLVRDGRHHCLNCGKPVERRA